MTDILRQHIFPTQGGHDEATRQDGSEGVSAAARPGPIATSAAHSPAGESPWIRSGPCLAVVRFRVLGD